MCIFPQGYQSDNELKSDYSRHSLRAHIELAVYVHILKSEQFLTEDKRSSGNQCLI